MTETADSQPAPAVPPASATDDAPPIVTTDSGRIAAAEPAPMPVNEPAAPAPDWMAMGESLAAARAQLAMLENRMVALETTVDGAAKAVSFVPQQIRTLGGKVDALAAPVGESRSRELMLRVLAIYDLTEQLTRSLPVDAAAEPHRKGYDILRTQFVQLLALNGLTEIPVDGAFDPKLHCAAGRKPVDDPAREGCVMEVVRPGFRSEHAVLRYAEVFVGEYRAPAQAAPADDTQPQPKETNP